METVQRSYDDISNSIFNIAEKYNDMSAAEQVKNKKMLERYFKLMEMAHALSMTNNNQIVEEVMKK